MRFRRHIVISALFVLGGALATPTVASATHGGDREVSVGSNDAVFSQNKQNEPALAVDASRPNILVAGANDNIDMEACNAGDPTTCPFTQGVGVSGVYFSFNSGDTWVQPTYTGWTARHCVGPPGFTCTPRVGSIGTLPWYYENGLVSDGDPAVAFGPRRGSDGTFSWANGSRLYYANLTSNFSTLRSEAAFKGFEAVYVSRTDNVQAAAAGDKNAWMQPVLVTKQNAALFADKEQIWADNAASSPFFGNVYVCNGAFRSQEKGNALPVPITVSTSRNGGDTWQQHQITAAATNPQQGSRAGCTVRTDSNGVVYVVYTHFQVGTPGIGAHELVKSYDGGHTWTRPQVLFAINDACFNVDPVIARCVEDGIAGARMDLAAAPSIDIANGAPTGADATNEIIDTWADGRAGLNNEHVMVSYSTNGGANWSAPTPIEVAGDRGYYAAPGLSPDGTDLYVVYNAFTTPYRTNTTDPRGLVGVVRHADIGANGAPAGWTTLHRGAVGDPRGSSQNNLQAEFLGDYVYAVATRDYGAAVWNDARNAADCPAMDAWRMSLRTGTALPTPRPNVDCPATFGNTDIFGGSWADPTTP
jgi:hypothetical protein